MKIGEAHHALMGHLLRTVSRDIPKFFDAPRRSQVNLISVVPLATGLISVHTALQKIIHSFSSKSRCNPRDASSRRGVDSPYFEYEHE